LVELGAQAAPARRFQVAQADGLVGELGRDRAAEEPVAVKDANLSESRGS
jgi:hypothetical protein